MSVDDQPLPAEPVSSPEADKAARLSSSEPAEPPTRRRYTRTDLARLQHAGPPHRHQASGGGRRKPDLIFAGVKRLASRGKRRVLGSIKTQADQSGGREISEEEKDTRVMGGTAHKPEQCELDSETLPKQ
ncbi:hypothetical protein NL676_023419 [Syzygium grande]|nr:hypothetical protein NL676_023419 [Syzygium grande]